MDFLEKLKNKTDEVNDLIYTVLDFDENYQQIIFDAMCYSVHAGGKRIRPLLMQETYKLYNEDTFDNSSDIALFMAAIEMIHTYSLVHDDLPAMDNDDYRRGMLTTHKKFGHAIGILTGDAMLNYAYELIAKAFKNTKHIYRVVKAFNILSTKAGVFGMVGGQTVDVGSTGQAVDIDTLKFIYELKTGALLEAALMCGAVLAGAPNEDVIKMEKIGHALGMAFQIQDDILDITSTTEELGKPVLSDEKNNKTTYVTIYGVEGATKMVKEHINEAISLLDSIEYMNPFLNELVLYMITRKK
jgi:geranylgeranyl diphosphate synthase type II